MIANILVFLYLYSGYRRGWRRGFVRQIMRIIGFVLSIVIARLFYADVLPIVRELIPYPRIDHEIVKLLPVESVYYSTISFIALLIISKIGIRMISRTLYTLTRLPVIHTINRFLGAIFGVIERYIYTVILLLILIHVPATEVYIRDSVVARMILQNTPFVNDLIEIFGTF